MQRILSSLLKAAVSLEPNSRKSIFRYGSDPGNRTLKLSGSIKSRKTLQENENFPVRTRGGYGRKICILMEVIFLDATQISLRFNCLDRVRPGKSCSQDCCSERCLINTTLGQTAHLTAMSAIWWTGLLHEHCFRL